MTQTGSCLYFGNRVIPKTSNDVRSKMGVHFPLKQLSTLRVNNCQIISSPLLYTVHATGSLGAASIIEKTRYREISRSHEPARFVFVVFRLLWNLTGASVALLSRYISNLKAIRYVKPQILWLRGFTRFYDNIFYRIFKRSPGCMKAALGESPIPDSSVQRLCWFR